MSQIKIGCKSLEKHQDNVYEVTLFLAKVLPSFLSNALKTENLNEI